MSKIKILALIMMLSITLFGCQKKEESKDILIEKIPAFESHDLNGEKIDSKVFENQEYTLLNVWATYCAACLDELSDLQKISKENKNIQIVGLIADGDVDEINAVKVTKDAKVDFKNIIPDLNLKKELIEKMNVAPISFIVNKKGEILEGPIIGSRSKEEYEKIIYEFLKKNESK